MYVPALELIRRSPTFRVTGAGRAVGALVAAATAGGAPDAAAPAGLGAAAGAGAAGAAQASRPTASASRMSAGWTRCIGPPRAAGAGRLTPRPRAKGLYTRRRPASSESHGELP